MALSEFLNSRGVLGTLNASSRKQAIQMMCEAAAAQLEMDSRILVEAVMERERLGSTGVGDGVAIPHARIEGLNHVHGLFARLRTPVEFEAIDGRPADLIFLLLAPESAGADHLKALARISRVFRREDIRNGLRATSDKVSMTTLLTRELDSDAA